MATYRSGERWERRQRRLRCSVLPVAEKAEHKHVQGSVADAAGLTARKIPGTPNGTSDRSEWQRSTKSRKSEARRFCRVLQQDITGRAQGAFRIILC